MTRFAALCLFCTLALAPDVHALAREPLTNDQVRQSIVQESVAAYQGRKCSATIWMVIVLPHPGMLPSGPGIASSECSRGRITLSIGRSGKPAFLFDRRACFPAPTWRRRSHRAQRRGREERSHPEPRAARPFARAWRGWRAPDLPRSEHRGTLRTSRRIRPPPLHLQALRDETWPNKQRQAFEETDACSGISPTASVPNTILCAISRRHSFSRR